MHASFTSIVSVGIATALYMSSIVSATPVDLAVLEARAETNPLYKCWEAGNAGTDEDEPIPQYCTNANNVGFDSYTTLSTFVEPMTFPDHVTVGPWHCCATCYNNPKCIAWMM